MRVPPLRRRIEATAITVHTVDRPGGDFAQNIDEVVEELRETDAIIFLYDPTFDMPGADDRHSTFDFFARCLDTLRDRSRHELIEGALPQVFAVCVTKFDSVPVFALARAGLWATQDDAPPFSPRVADAHAKPFFDWLCSAERHRSSPWVHSQLTAKFPAARTRYFVTSAAGFRRDENDEVTLAFPDNVDDLPQDDGGRAGLARRLWSLPPHPVNVMEPVIALHDMARRGGR
jgi:hypothetical protein